MSASDSSFFPPLQTVLYISIGLENHHYLRWYEHTLPRCGIDRDALHLLPGLERTQPLYRHTIHLRATLGNNPTKALYHSLGLAFLFPGALPQQLYKILIFHNITLSVTIHGLCSQRQARLTRYKNTFFLHIIGCCDRLPLLQLSFQTKNIHYQTKISPAQRHDAVTLHP